MNLLAPDLFAEVFITVAADGTSHVYYSKIKKEDALKVASAIINAGVEFAQRYGYRMQVVPPATAEAPPDDARKKSLDTAASLADTAPMKGPDAQ